MQSQVGNVQSTLRTSLIHTDRPDSTKHVDLHVYIIPKQIWKDRQNSANNEAMERAVSAGFVRVPENLTIHDLRRYIIEICGGDDDFPTEFLYLRSVGRCLTKVKPQQEKELKVKNYRPPTTFAPEIYILEDSHDDDFSLSEHTETHLSRESPINQSTTNTQTWKKPVEGPPLAYPLFNCNHRRQNLTSIPESPLSTQLRPRTLLKLREEQDRLYLRQLDLARQRHELEDQQNKEEEAAVTIQNAFRNYRDRNHTKQQEVDAIELEHLQKEARKSTSEKREDGHDSGRLSHRLRDLHAKRIEFEANRDLVARRMHELHTQITIQRRQEKDLWKQKYLIEKNQATVMEEQNRLISKNHTDIHRQLEQATVRLNNTTKLRQQAEYESRLLRQELQQICSTLNAIERYRLPKESHYEQQQQEQDKPTTLGITMQY